MKKNNSFFSAMYIGIVFVFFFIFFSVVYPIILFDVDDWCLTFFSRQPWALWGTWNPIKVLPEVLMPFACQVSSAVLYPITGDFLSSYNYMSAFIMSLVTTIYVVFFSKLIREKFNLTFGEEVFGSFLFILLNFIIFRSHLSNNKYMFWSLNMCCYYNYYLPSVLNSIVVIILMSKKGEEIFANNKRIYSRGLMLLLSYLCIFSNLYSSFVIAIFCGVHTFLNLMKSLYNKESLIVSVSNKRIQFDLITLAMWFVSIVFEMNGDRAATTGFGTTATYTKGLKDTLVTFISLKNEMNLIFKPIVVITVIIITWIITCYFRKKTVIDNHETEGLITIGLSFMLSIIFLILLSAVVGSGYILRTDVLFGAVFFAFLFIFYSWNIFLRLYEKCKVLAPLLSFIILFYINTYEKVFIEPNSCNYSPQLCEEIGNYLIDEVIDADKRGDERVRIKVPEFGLGGDNWPLSNFGGDRIGDSLYKNGIISHEIEVEFVEDKEMNKVFGIELQGD